jgi:hypothetical protein
MIKKMFFFCFSVLSVVSCASFPGKENADYIPDERAEIAAASYMHYIINRIDIGGSIMLENDETTVIFKPDMIFELTDKKTGRKTEGRSVFYTGLINEHNRTKIDSAKVYLVESDINRVSLEQFLGNTANLDRRANSILVPVSCTETTVTYLYLKPVQLRNKEISFEIRKDPAAR